ncbi:hypothetical protein K2X05_04525 [bacterium]|nr:hypothetical protein [bacterium]
MTKLLISVIATFLTSTTFAAEVFSVDLSSPIEQQLSSSCPWITAADIQRVVIANPEKIGWSGGDVGRALGNLFGDSGVDVNYSNIAANIPNNTKAVLMDTQYYNNNGQAQIIVEELSLISSDGNKFTIPLNDSSRVLSQTQGHSGEAILICFTNDENYVRVSTKVTHQNVDGSRPTMGFSAFTAAALAVPLQ